MGAQPGHREVDGLPDVVTVQDDALVTFGSTGQRLFSSPFMGPDDRVQRSILASGVGDGLRLFAVTSSQEDGHSTVHTFDRHGAEAWPAHRSEVVVRGSNLGFPIADGFDGDGDGALYLPLGSRMYRFTADGGNRVGPIDWQYPNWVVAVHRPDSPITHLVTEQNAIRRVELAAGVDHAPVADFQASERPLVVLTCPDGRMIATGVDDATTVRTFDVHDNHEYPPLFLADGQATQHQRAPTGRLGDPTGIAELVDRHPGVVVGSDDGHLYAVYPCGTRVDTNPALAWSRAFDAAVGVPVFADTDGDRQVELIVPVADGYLYGIDGTHAFGLDAPQWIVDVEADQPDAPPVDIDETTAEAAIAARWAPVDGASYEYTVLDADDHMFGEWVETDEPRGTWAAMGLVEGESYRFVARARSANAGRSEEVISDGVFYRPTPPDELLTCGQDPLCSSCNCDIGGRGEPGPSPVVLATLALLIGWRRFT